MSSVEKKSFHMGGMVNPKNLFKFFAESEVKIKNVEHTGREALVYSTAFF